MSKEEHYEPIGIGKAPEKEQAETHAETNHSKLVATCDQVNAQDDAACKIQPDEEESENNTADTGSNSSYLSLSPPDIFISALGTPIMPADISCNENDWKITNQKTSFDMDGNRCLNDENHLTVRLSWPWSDRKPTTFESFVKLPTELRLRIWSLALPDSRLLMLKCWNSYEYRLNCLHLEVGIIGGSFGAFARCCVGMLQACRESYLVFSDHYVHVTLQGSSISTLWGEDTHHLSDLGNMPSVYLHQAIVDRRRDQLVLSDMDLTAIEARSAWLSLNGVQHIVLLYADYSFPEDRYRAIIEDNSSLKTLTQVGDTAEVMRHFNYIPHDISLLKIDERATGLIISDYQGKHGPRLNDVKQCVKLAKDGQNRFREGATTTGVELEICVVAEFDIDLPERIQE